MNTTTRPCRCGPDGCAESACPGRQAAATGTEARVCQDIARRQQLGLAKYGTSVEANPLSLREWLMHAYEETLDKAVYLKRAIEQIDRQIQASA